MFESFVQLLQAKPQTSVLQSFFVFVLFAKAMSEMDDLLLVSEEWRRGKNKGKCTVTAAPPPLWTHVSFPLKSLLDESGTDITAGFSIICLCFICHSEFRGGPCCLAPLLTPAALLGTPAQLHGTLVRGRGGHQHGAPDSPQLRGESAETVLLVGHRVLLHYLPSFRHLLEHICLWAAGGADTASSLMKAPSSYPDPNQGSPLTSSNLDNNETWNNLIVKTI